MSLCLSDSSWICSGSCSVSQDTVSSILWDLPGQWVQSPHNGWMTWPRMAYSWCDFCWRASERKKVWRSYPYYLHFSSSCCSPTYPVPQIRGICTFSYMNGREKLIFSRLPLHIQMTDPDNAPSHCLSCRLSCIYEFIPTPVLEYIYFIYKTIIKALL